jgi:hypothetical protein
MIKISFPPCVPHSALVIVLTLFPWSALHAEGDDAPEFLRLLKDEQQRLVALQTSVVSFSPRQGAGNNKSTVDLVSAVHIGDEAYYDELNRRFAGYDAVLYELVAPADGQRPSTDNEPDNPVSLLQFGLTRWLDLKHQLDCIDYSRANFKHADLTPREFARSMKRRGESVAGWMFEMAGLSLADSWNPAHSIGDAELLAALIARDRSRRLKMLFARQLEHGFDAGTKLGGEAGSTLINERNSRAMQVLDRQLRNGTQRIAIFYGAAHLPDIAHRLTNDYGFAPTETRWLTAWQLSQPENANTSDSADGS